MTLPLRSALLAIPITFAGCYTADASVPFSGNIDPSKPFTVPKADLGALLQSSSVVYTDAAAASKSDQPVDAIERQKRADADAHELTVATIGLTRLTGVLAFAAVIQMGMFIYQLVLTRRAAADSRTAALAAKASAEALPKIERAYLFVAIAFEVALMERMEQVGPGALNNVQNTYRGRISVAISNHGRTPAVLRRLRTYADMREDMPAALIAHPNDANRIPDGLVIPPGSRHMDYIDLTSFNKERLAELYDVVSRIYCLGVVDYEDVLGEAHQTGFCWQSFPNKGGLDFVISPSDLNYRT